MVVPFPTCANGGAGDGPADQRHALLRRPRLHRARRVRTSPASTIQFAGLITFDGVIAMSNAVGGVDVCVGEPDQRPVHRPRPRRRAPTPAGRRTRSRSCAAATASATAATSAASARSRCSCRRWCARSRATTPSPNFGKLYGIAQAATQNITLSRELHPPRHAGVDRAGAEEHPAREHRLRAVPGHDRRHAASTRARCSRSPSIANAAVRRDQGRPADRPRRERARAALTADRRSTRTRRRRRPTRDADADPTAHRADRERHRRTTSPAPPTRS